MYVSGGDKHAYATVYGIDHVGNVAGVIDHNGNIQTKTKECGCNPEIGIFDIGKGGQDGYQNSKQSSCVIQRYISRARLIKGEIANDPGDGVANHDEQYLLWTQFPEYGGLTRRTLAPAQEG